MTWCRRVGVSAYRRTWSPGAGGALLPPSPSLWRTLASPGSRKRLPSKNFHADDYQMKILAKLRDLRCQHSLELRGQEI
jgi:hypothetical protein